jgi:hypothetical protein
LLCSQREREKERRKKETPKWKSFLLQKILQLRGALMQQARQGRHSVCMEHHRHDINSPSFCALICAARESESDRPYLNFYSPVPLSFGLICFHFGEIRLQKASDELVILGTAFLLQIAMKKVAKF